MHKAGLTVCIECMRELLEMRTPAPAPPLPAPAPQFPDFAGRQEIRKQERDLIVAWLREMGRIWEDGGDAAYIADRIEREDHLK